jgi:hypothetical protein
MTGPDRERPRIVVRKSADGWEVEPPEGERREELKPTIDSSPRPSPADDPRTVPERLAPGLPGGV